MNSKKNIALVLFIAFLQTANSNAQISDEKFRLNAFADMSYGFLFGDPADKEAAKLFEEHGKTETLIHDGFNIFGIDFVLTSYLSEKMTMQFEVQFEIEEQSEIEVDIERLYLDYRIKEWFNIQAGSFFTPIGYYNRFLYSRSWLIFQVQRPELFEEGFGGFVPTHMVGVNFYGTVPTWGQHSLNYAFTLGNGRGPNSANRIYKEDNNSNKQATVLLEWIVPDVKDFRIGLSGWTGKINSLKLDALGATGSLEDDTAERFELREFGFNPYVTLSSKNFNVKFEYVFVHHKDRLRNLNDETSELTGYGAEFSLNLLKRKLHPYVRYDVVNLPSGQGGPYFPIRAGDSDDELVRSYLPEIERVLTGIAYDFTLNLRLKLEYGRHLAGFREKNQIVFQAAYGI